MARKEREMALKDKIEGCELCGDFPVAIRGRCHPTAPLRIEVTDSETMDLVFIDPQDIEQAKEWLNENRKTIIT